MRIKIQPTHPNSFFETAAGRTGGWEKAEKAARVAFDQPACAPPKKVVSHGLK